MDYAVILLIVGSVAAGVVSAIVTTWSLRARVFSLEDRLAIVEGVLQREVKVRAATERWKKPSAADEAAALLLNPNVQPAPRKLNWWDNPKLKKGAYTP